ncbi:prolipoprotein diacylglyceryl transferase [Spiroplasma cantharicola]|uniref:Prolipoprotein diacylglyceryl transferase n=1 Tax=Spiroplasma cantharicola TaxID=362837 RepID=A0A0M4KDT3_9MOLU|nr:prolipoprotein diacylglyceryl transferase family protein [Spiroplasma cantharicola]ALD65982.1 prolipoprotein diacylglyceryl transferase [Spiroplasma cantharicola]
MLYGWIQKDNWKEATQWWTVRDDYGFIHVYALTMTLGVIFAVGISAIKLYRRGVSLTELWIGAAIIVPVSLLGASFFGKLNAGGYGKNNSGFFGLFAFWNGGMAIHGGVYIGTLAGLIIFYFLGRRTKVSLWVYADCIIPNILVGQGIGRWGNFFNHEIFGKPVALWNNGDSTALNWLPYFIRRNMVWTYDGDNGETLNGLVLEKGENYLMSPIFLYESMSLIAAWLIITFVIPNIGKWCSKKPWKVNPEGSFEGLSKFNIWKKEVYANHHKKEIELYKKEIVKIDDKNYIKRKWKQGRLLSKCNNPEKYVLIRSGVQAGSYFFVWNLVRLILEIGRPDDHLFLMYQRTLSLTIIALSMFFGLLVALMAQFVFPYLFRATGFIYEQEYFYLDHENNKEFKKEIQTKKIEKNKIKEEKARQKLKEKLEKK